MSLFFVNTPLQLVNALEARSYFGIDVADAVIPLGAAWNRERFEPLLQLDRWRTVQFVEMAPRRALARWLADSRSVQAQNLYQFWRRRRLTGIARAHRGVDRLFVGNYRNEYQRHFANFVAPRELILLDDGTDSILLARELRLGLLAPDRPQRSLAGQLRGRLRKSLIDWDESIADSVAFFSSYELEGRPQDRFIRNHFERIRRLLGDAQRTEEVHILGQPLVQDGYLTNETYLRYLAAIGRRHAGRRLIYIAHPRESSEALDLVQTRIGFEVRRLSRPVELELLLAESRPRTVASFFCSALDNCRLLFGELLEIEAWGLDQKDLLCAHENVAAVYEHFRTVAGTSMILLPPPA